METFFDKLMSRKKLFTAFWLSAIVMTAALVYYSATLIKEVPPIPKEVKSADGEVLYNYNDIVTGKSYFQQFDLQDYGTLLGMGAYLGPDYPTLFLHKRAEFLYKFYATELFGKQCKQLTATEKGAVKAKTIEDFRKKTILSEGTVNYTQASTEAYHKNKKYIVDFLVNGNKSLGYPGGVIHLEEAEKIADFFDWSQLVATTIRPGTDRTWSNNWPNEPMIDQNSLWSNVIWSLFQLLALWTLTIFVFYLLYEYIIKKENDYELEKPFVITSLFPSQLKLLKYIPIVTLFFVLQTIIGGYISHIYTVPSEDFIIPQSILPFNIFRALHINIAIIWVAIGWLVGGLFIAPLAGGKDLKFPWLVDILWIALLVVGAGGLVGIYMGGTGQLRDVWFWLGNEGREYLNLGRVWYIGLVFGLVLWFLMVFSTIRKAKGNNILIGTIIWSAFGVATLYIAGMMPIHKIFPNYTIDDYYRWWVVHLWVELTFELFAAGTLAYLAVSLGLVARRIAEKVMLFELVLIAFSGILGIGHHVWWQGTDEYWVALGSIFSSLEPLPLVLLMIHAWKEYKHTVSMGKDFAFTVPFFWLTGSAFLNWLGAGFFGMVINLPIVNYYAHGTYLLIPHGHVALLGAFGYISIAFVYITSRANALAKGLRWSDKPGKWGFWLVTIGVVLFAIPNLIVGLAQAEVSHDLGYYFARSREVIEAHSFWLWSRLLPDFMIIIGAGIVFLDLFYKTFLAKKASD